MAEYINVTLIDNLGEHIMSGIEAERIMSDSGKAFLVELKNLLDLRYTQCNTLEDAICMASKRKGAEVVYCGSLVSKKTDGKFTYFYDTQANKVKRIEITS